MRTMLLFVVALIAGATLGCGGADEEAAAGGDSPSSGPTWRRDIEPLVQAKCQTCHRPGGIAPFALQTYDEVHEVRELVKAAVTSRLMPPWLADGACAEYAHDLSLDEMQIATFAKWVDSGAPEGDAAGAEIDEAPATMSRIDLSLTMPEPYTAQQDPDDYRCFLIDWPESETAYVTGFQARPGNAEVVHHVIAFLIPPEAAADYAAMDEAEEGAGYTCFGGPGGGNDPGVSWIGSWAPGNMGGDLPAGTGLEVKPGSKIALQVHYNTVNGRQPDQTGIDLRIDRSVEKRAAWQFFADIQWLFPGGMKIPAGEPDVSHEFSVDPTPYFSDGNPFLIHKVGLHMHTRGTSARLSKTRADGTEECLLDIPRWDFHWQYNYDLATPTLVSPGDELNIGCHWDNSAKNQPVVDGKQVQPKDLSWGEGTGDEMCLGAIYVSEP